jgi:tight adherence protein B
VRAGNAFSIALELYAAEAKEPLKSAFLKVTREMALGAGLEDALRGLIDRVPLFEVRFFVSAVLLQRETGGNLSEVLGKLAGAVRERARLQGQVKAASGQGRLTAKVLTVLPIAVVVLLKLISPSYLENLTNDPVGRNLLAAAVVSQTLGYLCMQKIARVEV